MTTSVTTTTSFAFDNRHLAETYDRLSDTQFESGKELVRHLGPLEGARVLDVGCGTGRLAQWIADLVGPSGSVIGIDPLPERISIARAHASGIRFEVGQAEDLSAFADESFDAASMSSVFHWVGDKPKALAEIRRVLRPGGRIGLTTLSRELSTVGTLNEVLNPLLQRAPYAGRLGVPDTSVVTPTQTMTDLISTVLESGLELEKLHVTPRIWVLANGEEVLEFLESSSFGNFLRVVPEELRGALRADLAEAFDARKGPDGILIRTWITLLVASRV